MDIFSSFVERYQHFSENSGWSAAQNFPWPRKKTVTIHLESMRTWCFGYLRKTGNLSHNFFDKKTYQRCSSPDFKFDLFVSGRLCLNRGSAGVWLHFLEDDLGSIICVNESRLGEVATFFWEGIPMDHSQRKEGILIGILASVALTECHGVAISGYPMSGLDVIGKGHSHEAINLLLYKRDQTVHWLSLFKCLPA